MNTTFISQNIGEFTPTNDVGLFHIAVGLVIINEKKQVLLTRRSASRENNVGKWEIVYGRMHEGEDPRQTALRETKEEVGLDVELIHVVAIKHFIRTANDCEFVGIVFVAKALSMNVTVQEEEISEWQWVSLQNACDIVAEYDKEPIKKVQEILDMIL